MRIGHQRSLSLAFIQCNIESGIVIERPKLTKNLFGTHRQNRNIPFFTIRETIFFLQFIGYFECIYRHYLNG